MALYILNELTIQTTVDLIITSCTPSSNSSLEAQILAHIQDQKLLTDAAPLTITYIHKLRGNGYR